ncbi:hypothetical protein [Nakamurella lactea]|uniref:hypothetical protein n=1 Tax=Nakamurella lactea TaxID=459515 RepID=UPI00040197D1|nr:hypothetical protein [Nakamurella lactea]
MAGVTGSGGTPLALCDGSVGGAPTPSLGVKVGQKLLFQFEGMTFEGSGAAPRNIHLSSVPAGAATVAGWTITPAVAGVITIRQSGWPCGQVSESTAQPTDCVLVTITAR